MPLPNNKDLADLDVDSLEKVLVEAQPGTEPEPETKVEDVTPEEKPEEKQVEEVAVNPFEQRFKDLGLDKQYKSIDDMMERIPYYNKYTTQVAQENAGLKRRQEEYERRVRDLEARRTEPAAEEIDADKFLRQPEVYLDKRYPTRAELAGIQEKIQTVEDERIRDRIERFAEKHPDTIQLVPFMLKIAEDDPGFMKLKDPLPALYREAREYVDSQVTPIRNKAQATTTASRQIEKDKAQTTGTGAKPTSRTVTPKDLANLPLDELEKRFGFVPD